MRLIGTVSLGAFVLVAFLAASHFDHAAAATSIAVVTKPSTGASLMTEVKCMMVDGELKCGKKKHHSDDDDDHHGKDKDNGTKTVKLIKQQDTCHVALRCFPYCSPLGVAGRREGRRSRSRAKPTPPPATLFTGLGTAPMGTEPIDIKAMVEITLLKPPDLYIGLTRTYLEPGTLPGGEPVKIDAHSPWKLRGVFHILRARQVTQS